MFVDVCIVASPNMHNGACAHILCESHVTGLQSGTVLLIKRQCVSLCGGWVVECGPVWDVVIGLEECASCPFSNWNNYLWVSKQMIQQKAISSFSSFSSSSSSSYSSPHPPSTATIRSTSSDSRVVSWTNWGSAMRRSRSHMCARVSTDTVGAMALHRHLRRK